jgi:hypothetical protein
LRKHIKRRLQDRCAVLLLNAGCWFGHGLTNLAQKFGNDTG